MTNAQRPRDSQAESLTVVLPDPKAGHLAFLRWLAERGLLEHRPLGPPSGRYAVTLLEAPRR